MMFTSRRVAGAVALAALALSLPACAPADGISAQAGTRLRFDPDGGFWDAPFPIVTRMRADGTLVVADFPNRRGTALTAKILAGLESSPVGFGTTSAIYFPFSGPLDPRGLPDPTDPAASTAPHSSVFLVDVDPDSPERGRRVPIWTTFKAAAETYTPENVLVVLPRPGIVLRPATRYAAVVTDELRAADGGRLGSPLVLEQLKAGREPAGPHGPELARAFALLWEELGRAGLPRARVRAATVFRTGDPHREMDQLADWVRGRPAAREANLRLVDDLPTYCVVAGDVAVPLVQDGDRPFTNDGGEIRLDAGGAPEVQDSETIRFAVTIPKRAMPPAGFPLLLYAAGQGGSYTQVVGRGTSAEPARVGRGPAYYLADVGIAALSIEAPLVGPRHPDGDTSGIEFFNVGNPAAFRDNARQAALDFVTLVGMAPDLTVPAALCPGAGGGDFTFDASSLYFYGHSTGATVGSIVLGIEPRIAAGMLSGVGGSWLYNLTEKFEPIDFGGLVALVLQYDGGDQPDLYDPVINFAQTFAESSEPLNWARRWAREPRPGTAPKHILIIEGVIDGYFPPPAVNALALAAQTEPVLPTVEPTLEAALAEIGLAGQAAPAGPNLSTPGGSVAALLVQYLGEGYSGHYVPFERPEPKYQYRCFFRSLAIDAGPVVPAGDASPLAPCP